MLTRTMRRCGGGSTVEPRDRLFFPPVVRLSSSFTYLLHPIIFMLVHNLLLSALTTIATARPAVERELASLGKRDRRLSCHFAHRSLSSTGLPLPPYSSPWHHSSQGRPPWLVGRQFPLRRSLRRLPIVLSEINFKLSGGLCKPKTPTCTGRTYYDSQKGQCVPCADPDALTCTSAGATSW